MNILGIYWVLQENHEMAQSGPSACKPTPLRGTALGVRVHLAFKSLRLTCVHSMADVAQQTSVLPPAEDPLVGESPAVERLPAEDVAPSAVSVPQEESESAVETVSILPLHTESGGAVPKSDGLSSEPAMDQTPASDAPAAKKAPTVGTATKTNGAKTGMV
jgi:hypothetical protein